MINLILFGPPGSGKGTQAKKLAEKYNLHHISTGDLFRMEIGEKTELGQLAEDYLKRGELVPDSVTVGMLKKKVNATPGVNGFIYDGFPRTVAQAKALDQFLIERDEKISALIALEVDEAEVIERIFKRGVVSGRPDDTDENVIKSRFQVYRKETEPVFKFYELKGRASQVDGMGSIEEIFNRLCRVLDGVTRL
jgi:adenylate kinase